MGGPESGRLAEPAFWLRMSNANSGGALQHVHVRLGQDADDNVYWDLGDPGWKLLKISPEGWSVVIECR